jgi:hypothetical protein
MDMRKYSGATFIKVADVSDGPLQLQIAVIKEGKYDKPNVVFETGETLSLNATNNKTLIRAYGADSKDWVGKDVELTLGQVEFQAKLQDAVIVKPISPALAATDKQKAAAAFDGGGGFGKAAGTDDEVPF